MSKYLLSAGIVWVFLSFVIGIIILTMPREDGHSRRIYKTVPSSQLDDDSHMMGPVNSAKTSVQVEGTAQGPSNEAKASVKVLPKK